MKVTILRQQSTVKLLLSLAALFSPALMSAADKTTDSGPTYMSNGVFLVLLATIILLGIIIIGLTEMVKAGASQRVFRDKQKKNNSGTSGSTTAMLVLLFTMAGTTLLAQGATPAAAPAADAVPEIPFDYWGLGGVMFYSMLIIIAFELLIIYVLYRTGIRLLKADLPQKKSQEAGVVDVLKQTRVMKSIIDSQPAEVEAALLMDHDYDGIKELDNNLPGWWKYGFYFTIVVGVIYLFNYHVLHNGLSSKEEYDKEMADAEKQVAEYKRTAANSVDENTVTKLTDGASLSSGKMIFMQNCIPCHGELAEGKEGLGPNLTDDYWIHQGGVVNVFKSVKYGWTEKGMKSWQQDLKPLEMQQVVSYVLSLRGSNPPNAKAKEGDLYVEEGPATDSTKVADSAQVADSIQPIDTVKKK